MKLSFFGIKASTLCVGGSLLLLGGFSTVGLAGCGGGGGGGGVTSNRVNATVQLVLQSGDPASGATLDLLRGNRLVVSLQADDSGTVTIPRIAPGTYSYQLTPESGDTSTGTVTINAVNAQTYVLYEGQGNQFPYRITGTVLLNPSGGDDPDGNQNTSNCSATSDPVTSPLLIQVRDLNTAGGGIIVAQAIRPVSESGQYTITIPRRLPNFRVEVRTASDEGETYAGNGGITSFPNTLTELTGINICANDTNVPPVAAAPAGTKAAAKVSAKKSK